MLDDTDRKIIELLKEDARLSVRKIADKLGLSPAAVSKRLNKLRKRGIIKKYTVILDEKYLQGICSLMLLIRLDKGVDPDEFASKLSELPEICICIRITGYYEIMATAKCNDTSEVNNLLKKIREMGNVAEITTSLIISRYKITPIFL